MMPDIEQHIRTAVVTAAVTVSLMAAGTILATPETAHADLASLREEAAQVQEKIDAAQEKLDAASRDYDDAIAAEETARNQASEAQDKQRKIEGEITRLQDRIGERAVYRYKTGPLSMLDMLLSIDSFEDMQKTFDAIDELNSYDQKLADEQRDLQYQWAQQENAARENEGIAIEQKEKADAIKQEAEAEIGELEEIYDGISAEVAAILYSQRASYSGGQAQASSSGINWSGVTAPADANDIVARAYAALGSPYSWGGVGNGGYDCSGLVSYCVSGEHTRIGTTSTFMGYERTSDPQPGDIVTSSGHCGIYIGDGQMIHASDYGTGVVIGNVQSDMVAVKS